MTDITTAKDILLDLISDYAERFELSKTVGSDYYEPGRMENLDQYLGQYDAAANTVSTTGPVAPFDFLGRDGVAAGVFTAVSFA